ncbi:TRAP transporter small permease [Arsenicitalea aurantiaca]|uniref:TRAP transporter small permease protein n=1 Tax=Arsenicitalea aurantiaca TaxID=1783274 RepID=A0A433XBD5_9HYPH|nr:TRAP transporter small permease [Arsenicitalea aurantiaca]RUT31407.1 TRAP transporter small permease [Arsenicitalea aurantiaca]
MQALAKRAALLLARTTETLATLLLITVTALNLTQVVGRYAFSVGFSWTEEVMRYLMIWLMMLGSVAAIYRVEHMGVETLENMVAPRRALLVRSALYSVGGIFCVVVMFYGWPLALRNAGQVAPASGIPMIYPYMALPVGAFLILVQIALSWFGAFDEHRAIPEASGEEA